jgi:hypothetical protein
MGCHFLIIWRFHLTLSRGLSSGGYHLGCHLGLSYDVVIGCCHHGSRLSSCYHLCVIWGCHQLFSFGLLSRLSSRLSSRFSSKFVIWCCHVGCNLCCHLGFSSGFVI